MQAWIRHLFLVYIGITFMACSNLSKEKITFADNVVIAHRGAWKQKSLPQNSIASLKQAIALNCAGSEFDVRMTADNVLIVTHDADYYGMEVEETLYSELSKYKLPNGETIPTLKQYLIAGMQNNPSTGLVLEIKPSKLEGRNDAITENVIELVKELNAEDYILSYISFSYTILKRIKELDTNAKTQYLDGSKPPERLKEDGITGMDYLVYKYKKHPEWIKNAKKSGILLNAWVGNTTDDIDFLLAHGFDYITTDEPELVFERIKKSPTNQGYELVWSDEFNYKGKPDPTKWIYDYGFKANQEKQYFVDSIKNARVEDGHLIIEAHKEKVANKDFKNPDIKGWAKYKAEIDTAQYTSARIKTEGLAEWQYGRIEVSAKLPKGRGMWPAIWMLSENRKEIGWPESGECGL